MDLNSTRVNRGEATYIPPLKTQTIKFIIWCDSMNIQPARSDDIREMSSATADDPAIKDSKGYSRRARDGKRRNGRRKESREKEEYRRHSQVCVGRLGSGVYEEEERCSLGWPFGGDGSERRGTVGSFEVGRYRV